MYMLSKVFTYIFLPPGIFILILFLGAIYASKKKLLFLFSAIIFYALSITPISNYLLEPLESFSLNETSNPKAIVILSGGANKNDFFKAYADPFKREVYGFYLAKESRLPIVFSGAGEQNESKLAKEDFEKLSKMSSFNPKIFYENSSLNTEQNAKFTAKLFEEKNISKSIILVTSAYHMKRASFWFKSNSFQIVTKPINKLVQEPKSFSYLPNMRALFNSYRAIHEYCGLLLFAIKEVFWYKTI